MNTKGFIGPIGDDLPSLIPIVFSLAIFFATFSNSFSTFDEKNLSFSDDLDALKVARIMRSNGYIINYENFNQLCKLVQVKSIRFVAGIAELNTNPEDSLNPEKPYDYSFISNGSLRSLEELFYNNNDGIFVCSNLNDIETGFTKDVLEFKKTIVRSYPIILEKDRGNDLGIIAAPMQLVVIAWRE